MLEDHEALRYIGAWSTKFAEMRIFIGYLQSEWHSSLAWKDCLCV